MTYRNASHFKKALDLDLSPCALWVLEWPARHIITLLNCFDANLRLRSQDTGRIFYQLKNLTSCLVHTLNCSLLSYFRTGWILTFVRGFTIGLCAERYLFTQIQLWRLPADFNPVPRTFPLKEKGKALETRLSWPTTHPCNHACCRKIKKVMVFAHCFGQIFDCTGLKYVLNFGFQISYA